MLLPELRNILGKFGILGELTSGGPRPLGEESCCLQAVFYTSKFYIKVIGTYIVHSVQIVINMFVDLPLSL